MEVLEPTLDRQDSDESKTFDNSVLIHPDNAPIASSAIIGVGSRSVPANIYRMKSPGSQSSSHNQQDSPHLALRISGGHRKSHHRQASVSTLIPRRLHNKMPSLIQYLDTGSMRMPLLSMAINPMKHSHSAPSEHDDEIAQMGNIGTQQVNISPVVMTKDDSGARFPLSPVNDDGTITPRSTANGMFSSSVTPDGGTLARQSQEMTVTTSDLKLENQPSSIHSEDSELRRKRNEYEDMIPTAKMNNEQMVDMQQLARMAAEEFASLANDNERYFKENEQLKVQLAEMRVDKGRVEEELVRYKNMHENDVEIGGDIETLKSEAAKWELEKQELIQEINNLKTSTPTNRHNNGRTLDSMGLLSSGNSRNVQPDESMESQQFMREQLVIATREKNELQALMEDDKMMKRQYEITISNLRKQLKDSEERRRILDESLERQRNLYVQLEENTKRKAMEIDDFAARTRAMTLEEQQQTIEQQQNLLEAIDEQKQYIEHLEIENQRLLSTKLKEDDIMFQDLAQYKHRFARSVQLNLNSDAVSDLAESDYAHSRMASESLMSNPFFSAITSKRMIMMDGMEEVYEPSGHPDLTDIAHSTELSENNLEDEMTTMTTTQSGEKKVKFDKNKEAKEKKDRKKQEVELRLNAEIEFFLLTAIAVKNNLVEEYPEKTEVMTEDAMHLYRESLTEHVAMNKFHLWIEYKLREKYDLPKLKGFEKFLNRFDFKEKTEKLGAAVKRSADTISARIRSVSRANSIDRVEDAKGDGMDSNHHNNGQTLNIHINHSTPPHQAGQESTGIDDIPDVKHRPCCIVM